MHAKATPPHNYRESFPTPDEQRRVTGLLDHLLESGITLINTCTVAMSTVHTESEIDTLVAAMESGFVKMRESA